MYYAILISFHGKMPIFPLDNKHNGSFALTGTDSDTDSDSDSKAYFCLGQESESESVPESVSDNVNES